MSAQRKKLQYLARLTGARRDAELAALGQTLRVCENLRSALAALDAAEHAQLREMADVAKISGADQLWLSWANAERARLNRALARARAEHSRAQAKSARLVARHIAVEGVIGKM